MALRSSPNPSVVDNPVTFTASVTPGDGSPSPVGESVHFQDMSNNASPVGDATVGTDGQAVITTSSLSVGTHEIEGVLADTSGPVSSNVIGQTVWAHQMQRTTTTFTISPKPGLVGQSWTFAVTVAAQQPGLPVPTGTVTFGTNPAVGTLPLVNGQVSVTVPTPPAGNYSFMSAVYSGDDTFWTSAALAFASVVWPTTTTLVVPAHATEGAPISLTANVTSPAGTVDSGKVTFSDGTTSLGTAPVSAGTAVLTTPAMSSEEGTKTITASYSPTDLSSLGTSASAPVTLDVVDAALTATGSSVRGSEAGIVSSAVPASGAIASFTDADPGGQPSDYTATIDWGDGTTSTGSISGSGPFHVSGSHSYAEDGTYKVAVTISDTGGARAAVTTTAAVADPANPVDGALETILDRLGQ